MRQTARRQGVGWVPDRLAVTLSGALGAKFGQSGGWDRAENSAPGSDLLGASVSGFQFSGSRKFPSAAEILKS